MPLLRGWLSPRLLGRAGQLRDPGQRGSRPKLRVQDLPLGGRGPDQPASTTLGRPPDARADPRDHGRDDCSPDQPPCLRWLEPGHPRHEERLRRRPGRCAFLGDYSIRDRPGSGRVDRSLGVPSRGALGGGAEPLLSNRPENPVWRKPARAGSMTSGRPFRGRRPATWSEPSQSASARRSDSRGSPDSRPSRSRRAVSRRD